MTTTLLRVCASTAPLRREPRPDAPLDTEALFGEEVIVSDEEEGWVRGRLARDGYEGFLPSAALGEPGPAATHKVEALRSFVYPGPNIKLPPRDVLPFGAAVSVEAIEADFARLASGGRIWARHLGPADGAAPDFVAVAERFRGVPYLWGGKTCLGLDCSGLVQVALAAAGHPAPRDSGPQERTLGERLAPDAALRRGDLVFWRGHVGIMRDAATLLHANGYTMTVLSEPLAEACARIEASGGGPMTSARRLISAQNSR